MFSPAQWIIVHPITLGGELKWMTAVGNQEVLLLMGLLLEDRMDRLW